MNKTAFFAVSETANHMIVCRVCSESSMFVSKRRLILKTCGTTTPLQCLESLLELVEEYTGFDDVEVNVILRLLHILHILRDIMRATAWARKRLDL